MVTFLLTLVIFTVVVGGMAIGVMVTGRRLQGSCGGVEGAACVCSDKKRAECREKGAVPHSEIPIDPASLNRRG